MTQVISSLQPELSKPTPLKNAPLRMIHIVGDSKWGGGGSIILALAKVGKRMGWHVDMLTTDPICMQVMRDHDIGVVNLDVIKREINVTQDLSGLYRLYRFLRTSGYDIVHTHTSKAGFVGRIAARLSGIPGIVHTVHGFAFHEESSRTARLAYSNLERMAAWFCDYIVTVSEYHRDWALRLQIGKPGKLLAIPNGIDCAQLMGGTNGPALRSSWGVQSDGVVLLTTGRLAYQKGLIYLLQALPLILAGSQRKVKLVLAGDGPLRNELENAARELNVQDNVLFLGFRRDLADLLDSCDCVLLPSLYEGLSIALLEAMASGKPVISTTIGSNLEVTRNGAAALLVEPKNPTALADAVLKVIHDPEAAQRRAALARDIYLRDYTAERMMNEYQALYEKLGAKGRRRAAAQRFD